MVALSESQHAFASHVRDPERVPGPRDIEPRRMKIYQDLVYNNLESFVRNGFPVLHSLIDPKDWGHLVRTFLIEHRAQTPYFLEISQEFLQFLQLRAADFAFLPPFTLELAHYEWMELAMDVAPEELPEDGIEIEGDLLSSRPIVNPLAWVLAYHYPVHRIRRDFRPEVAEGQPIYLVVYRNREDKVRFLELNTVTARLLELLRERPQATGRDVLQQIAVEMPELEASIVMDNGAETLTRLRSLDILLGTETLSPTS